MSGPNTITTEDFVIIEGDNSQTVYRVVAIHGQTCWIKNVQTGYGLNNTDCGRVQYWDDLIVVPDPRV